MNKKIFIKLFLIALLIFPTTIFALEINSKYAVMYNLNDDTIIFEKNKDEKTEIASLTKIMTCIVAIENINNLNDTVVMKNADFKGLAEANASVAGFSIGDKVTYMDLLMGLFLPSGADAALALANNIGGNEKNFVKLMNEKAKELHMTNTTFNNSSGLDENKGNYSTTYDMALLTKYAMNNKIFMEIVGTKSYVTKTNFKSYSWTNKNKLLKYDFITGGKTGYTEKAKRTLVTTANINNMDLIVVTIRDSDDWNTHLDLYNYAEENYIAYKVLNKSKFKIENDTYFNGTFYIKNDIYIPFKKEETGSLISHIKLYKTKNYQDNDVIGENQILYKNKVIYTEPIYIKTEVPKEKKTFFDKIRKWFKND